MKEFEKKHLSSWEELPLGDKVNRVRELMRFGVEKVSLFERLEIAVLLLDSAEIARSEQELVEAKSALKAAHGLLQEYKWNELEPVFDRLLVELARVNYYLGEFDEAEMHLDLLIENGRNPQWRFEAFELKIIVNNHLGRYKKSLMLLEEVLHELGLELPLGTDAVSFQINRLQGQIKQELQDLPVLAESEVQAQSRILKLLYIGGMAIHHTSDLLMTWAALQIVIRSRLINLPSVRSLGLVSYGRMKVIAGEIEEGFDLGLHGLNLNSSIGDIQYRCRVLGVFGFYILPWKESFQKSNGLLLEGMEVARKSGDLIGLYILKTHLFNLHFLSGKPIQELLGFDFKESYVGMELTYYITHYQKELIRYVVGESAFLSLPKQEARGMAAKLTLQEETFYRHYVLARYYFLFGYYKQALRSAKLADQNRKLQEGSPLVPANLALRAFSLTQNWSNLSDQEQMEELEWLLNTQKDFDTWASKASDNFSSTSFLLQAELARITSVPYQDVEAMYISAIQLAQENLYQKALSHELFGKYYLGIGQKGSASTHLQHALYFYHEWGAVRKTEQLTRQFAFLIREELKPKRGLDLETILYELAGEIHATQISQTLMALLMRVSASSRAMIQWVDPEGMLKVFDQKQLMDLPLLSKEKVDEETLVSYFQISHRNKTPLIFNHLSATQDDELGKISRQGILSCLFFPVGFSENQTMIVYLESCFDSEAYTAEIIRWVGIVARQGGVILDNARNYENTLRLNEEIRQEMMERQKLLELIEKQKDAHIQDLIRVQEYERERIAGDLHDSLGSQLSTLKLNLAHLFEQYQEEDLLPKSQKALQKLDEAIDDVRRIAHHMSPVSLKKFGLASGLQTMIESFGVNSQIKAELQILGFEERLDSQLELTLYRICQELVHNVLRHSRADEFRLQLINHGSSLNISIEDNGVGMEKSKDQWGMGLLGIETKVQMLGGTMQIESQSQMGCLVMVDIPVLEKI